MVVRSNDTSGNQTTKAKSTGELTQYIEDARKEQQQKDVTGSSAKTPWSTDSYVVGGPSGVSVPRDYASGDIFVETGTLRGIVSAADPTSAVYNELRSPADTPNFYALSVDDRDLFEQAAKAVHPLKTGQSYYEDLIQASWDLSTKGVYMSPQMLAYAGYQENAGKTTGGKYTGPVATRTIAAESDVRATADAVAMEMLGRAVTDEEYDRILKRTRKAERNQPQVTTSGRGYSTTQQGLSAEGRQDIVENILAKKPEYQEFQKATTLMSWFDEALNRRMR